MSDDLGLISRHVKRVLAQQAQPLYLVVDDDLVLRAWRGNGAHFGMPDLVVGQSLHDKLAMLATANLEGPSEHAWRFVQLPGQAICHVHVVRVSAGWGVALLDACREHAEQQVRQQAAHELLLLRAEREQLIGELEQANALKNSFIARMSHEFRTPLTSVIGYSEQLREIRADDREAQHHLDAVTRGARYLLNLVENLLDQARIEVDQLQLNPGACELHELSAETEQLLRPVAMRKQLSLAWRFHGEIPPRLWLDATRLKQILINLVGNAIKFTQQGGISVELEWRDGRLRISVSDTGPGISDEDASAIFEPFRQGRDNQQAKGAGLGLAISQSLVHAMGGEITLVSREGEGARFGFEIDAPTVNGGRGASPGSLLGKKVLVADDDPDLLELLCLYLGAAGCDTQTARDAAGTVEAVQRFAPDAVVLDLNLGSDDGVAIANTLRRSGYHNPIVLLSAALPGGDHTDPDTGRAIDARWSKPIGRARLLEGLAGLIG